MNETSELIGRVLAGGRKTEEGKTAEQSLWFRKLVGIVLFCQNKQHLLGKQGGAFSSFLGLLLLFLGEASEGWEAGIGPFLLGFQSHGTTATALLLARTLGWKSRSR